MSDLVDGPTAIETDAAVAAVTTVRQVIDQAVIDQAVIVRAEIGLPIDLLAIARATMANALIATIAADAHRNRRSPIC